MVPLDTLVEVKQISGPNFASRFNLYPAAEIIGAPAPGSSAQALKAIEEVAKSLPSEAGYESDGETIFFISSPSAGLWATRERLGTRE